MIGLRRMLLVFLALSGDAFAETPLLPAASLRSVGYGQYWSAKLSLVSGDQVVAVKLLEENLYVGTNSGVWFAVQADTGLVRWAASTGDSSAVQRMPSHLVTDSGDGPVVLTSHARVDVLDRYTGETVRRINLPLPASGAASADPESMFLGGADGRLYSLRWYGYPWEGGLVRWSANVDGLIASAPMISYDDRLYFVTNRGVVYCVGASDKSLIWTAYPGGAVSCGIDMDASGIYVASEDHRLYVLDERSGEGKGEYMLPGPLFDAPVVAQRTIYQYCPSAGLFAFDADTRGTMWTLKDARSFVARSAERLVVRDISGDLVFVHNPDGKRTGELDLPDNVLLAENRRDAVLYMASSDGRLMCAKPHGFSYLRREQMADARFQLNKAPAGVDVNAASANENGTGGRSVDAERSDPLRSSRSN